MKPIDFPKANKNLTAPVGMEKTCGDLPVYVNVDGDCMSVWELSNDDLIALQKNGGRIALWVSTGSGTQPPVCLVVAE